MAPLHDVFTNADGVDSDAAALRDDIEHRQRREAMATLATWLAATGPLRDGMAIKDAEDILWTMTSPEVHRLYRRHCAWSADSYAAWLVTALTDALMVRS